MYELKLLWELEYRNEPRASKKYSVPGKYEQLHDCSSHTTYRSRLNIAGSLKKRHGNMGSMAELLFVTYLSQNSRAIHKKADMDSKLITYADFQGNRESASSNPAVMDNVANRSRIAPTPSTLALDSFPNLVLKVPRFLSTWPW